jgi:hypothetical protein
MSLTYGMEGAVKNRSPDGKNVKTACIHRSTPRTIQ